MGVGNPDVIWTSIKISKIVKEVCNMTWKWRYSDVDVSIYPRSLSSKKTAEDKLE